MASTSSIFSSPPEMLFSPEQLQSANDQSQALYNDAYGAYSANGSSGLNDFNGSLDNTGSYGTYSSNSETLPNFEVTQNNSSTAPDETDNTMQTNDSFEEQIRSNPASIGRIAKTVATDIELMLTSMARMKFDMEQLTKVEDANSITALKSAMDKELEASKVRMSQQFADLHLSGDVTDQVFQLLSTIRQGLAKGGDDQDTLQSQNQNQPIQVS